MANNIDIILKATDQASKSIKDATSQTKSAFEDLTGVSLTMAGGAAAAAAAIKLLADGMKFSVKMAKETETVQVRLAAVVRATEGAAGLSTAALLGMADSLMQLNSIDDELIAGAEAILLTFRNIGATVFPQAMQAAIDMGAVMGTDLNSAVLMLGKALNDPVEGLTALKRAGVSFTEEQKTMITTMVETGKVTEAQALIIEEMNKEFGGAGAANALTYAGSIDAVKASFGELGAVLGKDTLPALTITNAMIKDSTDAIVQSITVQQLAEAAKRGDAAAISELARLSDLSNRNTETYTSKLIENAAAQRDAARAAAGYIPLINSAATSTKLVDGQTVNLIGDLIKLRSSESLAAEAARWQAQANAVLGTSAKDATDPVKGLAQSMDKLQSRDIWITTYLQTIDLGNGLNAAQNTSAQSYNEQYWAWKLNKTGQNPPGKASGGDFVAPPGYPNDTLAVGVKSGERVSVTPANPSASSFPDGEQRGFTLQNYGKIEFVVKNGASLASIMQEMSQL
jgi:hypothetical protein